MIIIRVLLLSTVCCVSRPTSCKDPPHTVLLIDETNGRCEPACLQGTTNRSQSVPCCSIEYVAKNCGFNASNITIIVYGHIRVSEFVLFENITDLSICGTSSKAVLECAPLHSKSSLPGFQFVNVDSFLISGVKIVGCGARHHFINNTDIIVAVAVTNSSNVALTDVEIAESNGTSLLFENTFGDISLTKVLVQKNKLNASYVDGGKSYAGGVLIYFNSSVGGTSHSDYLIIQCVFKNITTPNYSDFDARYVNDTTNWLGYGMGGGLSILFDEDSTQNTVSVKNCTFQDNDAPWGAGVHIEFLKKAAHNAVFVKNSNFSCCTAVVAGGGMCVGFLERSPSSNNNTMHVSNSSFTKNRAWYGAGTYIYALPREKSEIDDVVSFSGSSWIENIAIYSPAVDVSPTRFYQLVDGSFPISVFRDCNFMGNQIELRKHSETTDITFGVFVITRFKITLSGTLCFHNNSYTALLLNSGKVILEKNTRVQFMNNTGFRGGAIALNGFSYLSVSDNCLVEFLNNKATEYGGAIFYYPIEQREIFEGRVCFLHYNGQHDFPVSERNISFVFAGNSAIVSGSSIYSTSLYACYFTYRSRPEKGQVNQFIEEIGNFTFSSNDSSIPIWGTTGHHFIRDNRQSLQALPGMALELPLMVKDELNQTVNSDFFAQVPAESNISLTSPYTNNRAVVLLGSPSSRASLIVSTLHTYRSIQCSIDVVLTSCSPGYYYDNSSRSRYCTCSSSQESKAYRGIIKCNPRNFTAVIKRGYWAGYLSPNSTELYTAPCPIHFCAHNRLARDEYSLPNSTRELSLYMCGPKRQGVLCAECTENHSVYYHSKAFTCGSSDKCSYGIFFFFLSELFPVLIFFTLTVIFDWSFSSGSRNGFVFFSQMVTILPLDYITSEAQQPTAEYLQIGYKIIYGFFNIDFFSVEPLSYCLFQNATVMDALAFKYITTVFALILVISLTVCINRCICCNTLCTKLKKKVTTKESVLNGLSAFLVICYLELVRTSLFILRLRTLRGAGGISGPVVAFYSGNNYFEGKHVFYAIPALITLGTIGFVPPMLLLLYPALLKLLQLCKVSEHKFVLVALRVTRLNALLPMLDVFQGHFKDNLRFFAGLYFLYRVALLLAYSFSPNLVIFAVVGELVLLLILSFHSVAQPYKQSKYNIVDSLLLSNLAIINGLSVFVLTISPESSTDVNKFLIIAAIYLQLGLIYLPLVVIVSLFTVKVCKYARQRVKRSSNDDGQELLGYLEYLDDNRESDKDSVQETGDHQVW